ncbi:MAG: DUF2842 domain-containing protein [Sphingomonadales bacterium]
MTKPSIRKPLGVLLIVAIILVWAIVVVQAAGFISTLPWPVQAVVYLVAGIVWILPMGPVLRWMEAGR